MTIRKSFNEIFASGNNKGQDLANYLDADLQFKDLNIAIMGDSFGVLASPNNYTEYLLERLKFADVNNLSKSGATISHTASTVYDITITGGAISDNNVIWNQFNILKAGVDGLTMQQPDIVFIFAGTNDYSRTIGTPSTEFASGTTILDKAPGTILNISKGVRLNAESIWQEWPYCQIIFATPIQRGITDNATIFSIGDAIEGCGKYLATPVIRTDKNSGIYGFNDISSEVLLYDNLHPNQYGAVKIAQLFTSQFRSLINK